jgi:hypothetical protein
MDVGIRWRTSILSLVVKWSQVQILSARPELEQFRGGLRESGSRLNCVEMFSDSNGGQKSYSPNWSASTSTAGRAVESEVCP